MMIRLGGPVQVKIEDPEIWVRELIALGYSAAVCPKLAINDEAAISSFRNAAEKSNIVIAEVGAWSNPLSPDETTRKEAIRLCQERLALAEKVGALCCVNIAGSLGLRWDGPHPEHFTEETFTLIVDTVRQIIDEVKPSTTFYTLEMMPWMLPDNADEYLRLLRAVDRTAFGVHLDPVNVITSPRIYYASGSLLKELFHKLGPWIRSCHAKDIVLKEQLTVRLEETRPGLGGLDYHKYLQLLQALGREVPLILEHLPTREEYAAGAAYIRKVATELGISIS
jgi:sugar phosphate isomerase/epimerase